MLVELIHQLSYNTYTAPGQPSTSVTSKTATSISLSWSVPSGSVVDSYEVMWQRDTSGECPDEDEGSTTITDGSTDYTITELEEDSTYIITVTATNFIGNTSSIAKHETTLEMGMYVYNSPVPSCSVIDTLVPSQ